jgi:hypothetical protein
MNIQLLEDIKALIYTATTCENIFYYHLPGDIDLGALSITYELNLQECTDCFDGHSVEKIYGLRINLNAPQLSFFGDHSIYVERWMYRLVQRNSRVHYVKLVDENIVYDDELRIFTQFLSFTVTYS